MYQCCQDANSNQVDLRRLLVKSHLWHFETHIQTKYPIIFAVYGLYIQTPRVKSFFINDSRHCGVKIPSKSTFTYRYNVNFQSRLLCISQNANFYKPNGAAVFCFVLWTYNVYSAMQGTNTSSSSVFAGAALDIEARQNRKSNLNELCVWQHCGFIVNVITRKLCFYLTKKNQTHWLFIVCFKRTSIFQSVAFECLDS